METELACCIYVFNHLQVMTIAKEKETINLRGFGGVWEGLKKGKGKGEIMN